MPVDDLLQAERDPPEVLVRHCHPLENAVKLTLEDQQRFVDDDAGTFAPEKGGWGRQGCTAVRLDAVDEDRLGEALTLAWRNVSASVKGKKRASAPTPKPRRR